jgi:hypothetical protein
MIYAREAKTNFIKPAFSRIEVPDVSALWPDAEQVAF